MTCGRRRPESRYDGLQLWAESMEAVKGELMVMLAVLSYSDSHSNKLICVPFPRRDFNGTIGTMVYEGVLSMLSRNARG